jgi:hypothetical protein
LALLEAAGIPPTARAEDISVEGFVALARALHSSRHPGQASAASASRDS